MRKNFINARQIKTLRMCAPGGLVGPCGVGGIDDGWFPASSVECSLSVTSVLGVSTVGWYVHVSIWNLRVTGIFGVTPVSSSILSTNYSTSRSSSYRTRLVHLRVCLLHFLPVPFARFSSALSNGSCLLLYNY